VNFPLEACDEAELARMALAGRQAAYGELMRRHRDAVYRLVRSHVGDGEEALDVTQETFVSAFAALARYDVARPFRLWLARIAINKCRDWARKRSVRRFFSFARSLDEAAQVADPAMTPEASAADKEGVRRISKAIGQLPVSLRDVLVLRTIEGMSQAEAGQVLGISAKAVETRLYRARATLASILRNDM
jgi:RNA polymerase sigma-70 factor (ECF subfamily)